MGGRQVFILKGFEGIAMGEPPTSSVGAGKAGAIREGPIELVGVPSENVQ